ncbi:MAG TPA: antibiotic biosynthesis monooxygenase [Gaiellaceae bacterium]
MIVVRFAIKAQPEKAEDVRAALEKVIAPSRRVPGVIHFDIASDLTDAAAFIATEVFDDMVALERQEALPQVQEALAVLGESLASEPEATVFHVSSSAPWGS